MFVLFVNWNVGSGKVNSYVEAVKHSRMIFRSGDGGGIFFLWAFTFYYCFFSFIIIITTSTKGRKSD